MATYEYRARDAETACDVCRERFEVRQAMSEEPLTVCPECSGPVERVVSLCAISTTQSTKSMLSDKNLKQKGFSKLVTEGGGNRRQPLHDLCLGELGLIAVQCRPDVSAAVCPVTHRAMISIQPLGLIEIFSTGNRRHSQ